MTDSNPLLRLAAAVCAIVAIGLAAATVQSPLETDSGSGGSGNGGGVGDGAGRPPDQPTGSAEVPAFLEYLVALVVVIAALALVWYLIAHRREAVKQLAIGLAVLLVLVALVYAFANVVPFEPGEMNQTENVTGGGEPGDGTGSGDGDRDTSFSPTLALAVLGLVTALFVAGVLLTRDSSDGAGGDAARVGADESAARDGTTAAVGSAAGTAADRLEDADDFDNAIYRAWREMTEPLEVDRPESSTPREFARAATDAGLNRDDVAELTRLFEDVRYGDAPTTPEREARAVAVLRRIEAEYAAGETGPDETSRSSGAADSAGPDARGDGR